MARHADLTTAELLQLRATTEESRRLRTASSQRAAFGHPAPLTGVPSSSTQTLKKSSARTARLKQQPIPQSAAAHRPWEADCKTWAVRDKMSGTVVMYKHDDGVMCPMPGACMHPQAQQGSGTFHG